jgi:hypothetical protein
MLKVQVNSFTHGTRAELCLEFFVLQVTKYKESDVRIQNQRKTVRRTVQILSKSLEKFQTDLEVSRQQQQIQSGAQGRFVLGSSKKLKELQTAWLRLPVGQRDNHRRPWRNLIAADSGSAGNPKNSAGRRGNEHTSEALMQVALALNQSTDPQPSAVDTQVYLFFCWIDLIDA